MEIIRKYQRCIIAAVVAIAIVLLAIFGTRASGSSHTNNSANTLGKYSKKIAPELEVLINSYYTAYSAGDVAAVKAVASPVTDQEASFIQFYSGYISSLEGLKLYTKPGIAEGSYLVSAYIEYHYKGIDTPAPGLDFFYVETDTDGNLFINNLYGSFNQTNEILTMDPDVEQLIVTFEQEGDVLALQAEVQDAYNQAVAADSLLATLINETLQSAFIDWNTQYLIAQMEAEHAEQERLAAEAAAAEAAAEEARLQAEEDNAYKGKVSGSSVYVRREASSESTKIGTLTKGKEVKIYSQEGEFYKIDFGGVKAYVACQYISTNGPSDLWNQAATPGATSNDPSDKTVITVSKFTAGEKYMVMDSLKVRKDCSTDSDHLETVRKGDKVTIVESYANGWTKVKTSKNTGYIRTDLL